MTGQEETAGGTVAHVQTNDSSCASLNNSFILNLPQKNGTLVLDIAETSVSSYVSGACTNGPQFDNINDCGNVSIVSMNETSNNNLCDPIDCDILCESFNSDFNVENNAEIDSTESCHDTNDSEADPLIETLKDIRKNCKSNIIVSHVNINSLKHKFDYFHEILSEGLLDVLCVTETKLDDTYSSSLFYCKGFKCHRKDRTARSGGIMVFIRDDIPHTRMQCHEFNETNSQLKLKNLIF